MPPPLPAVTSSGNVLQLIHYKKGINLLTFKKPWKGMEMSAFQNKISPFLTIRKDHIS